MIIKRIQSSWLLRHIKMLQYEQEVRYWYRYRI